ncbi:MAG: inosine/xanthosine triphosphatase [Candidatus Bathyarchaeia archaeon]
MLVIVGSDNPIKIKAVKNVLGSLFGKKLKVKGVKVNLRLSKQPIGLTGTLKGAIRRAEFAIGFEKNADYGIGIEAGLIKVPYTISGYMDQQIAAILDRDSCLTIGASSMFELPKSIVERILKEDFEMEKVIEDLTGIKSIGEKQGAIGYFSYGKINRLKLTEQAVTMAFVPRMNKQTYGLNVLTSTGWKSPLRKLG